MPEIEPVDVSLKSLTGLHLWHAPMSSCSQRVRLVLAETARSFESHLVNLEKDEHATSAYQAIHPKGLVPALVEDGRLFIESIDIIQQIAGVDSALISIAEPSTGEPSADYRTLLNMANEAQLDLKLLTFEFLFRSGPPPPEDAARAFQNQHRNDWLRQFRRDFAQGFDRERIDAAVVRTHAGFRHLDQLLSDGRGYLSGESFSLSDIAWMPNMHRFGLMGWPFERTPHLADWFKRVSVRDSFAQALLDWQNEDAVESFEHYTETRRAEGTDIRSFGDLPTP